MPLAVGPTTIRSRAIDDSCNIEMPAPGVTLQAGHRAPPGRSSPPRRRPLTPMPTTPPRRGRVEFRTARRRLHHRTAFLQGHRRTPAATSALSGAPAGRVLATVGVRRRDPSGWQSAAFAARSRCAGVTYVVSVFMPNGHYAADSGFFNQAYELWPIRGAGQRRGWRQRRVPLRLERRSRVSSFGADQLLGRRHVRDSTTLPADRRRSRPGAGATALVSPTAAVSATFSEAMNSSSLVLELRDALGASVPGATSYHAPTRRLTFTPASPLAPHTTYTATVATALDGSGESIAAPFSWSFTTTGEPGTVPTGLWDSSAAPVAAAVG